MTETYEAVVVGAGPAGLAAATELTRAGIETLVLERGKFPGAKNATGGILYGQTNTEFNLDHLYPDFAQEAPVERTIDNYYFHCVSGEKVRSFDLTPLHLHEHKWSYSVLRAKFDRWFAERVHAEARKNGGGILSNIRVRGPLVENGRIVGVETDELDPIKADLVIAADGATSDMVRKAGLRSWEDAHKWFQGAKIVARMDPAELQGTFGLDDETRGVAHLFAGDLWSKVRGGGFLYTNRDTLSIGTVFHLDALGEARIEPHRLMDRLLTHPQLQNWLGDATEEVEYSAKLIPDGKKIALATPYKDNMLAIGDAAGQLQAQGPIIKGMNLGITAGILAARAYVEAKEEGKPATAGPRYHEALKASYVPKAVRPGAYALTRATAENRVVNGLLEFLTRSPLGRAIIRSKWGQRRIESALNNPGLAGAAPDIRFSYVTLPAVIAQETGTVVESREGVRFVPRTLDDRIGELDYDTDVGRPHILLTSSKPEHSGRAVTTCPVSSAESTRGCYRFEVVKTPEGREKKVVALDTQPCIECGTCAVMAATEWEHPRGGKGVAYEYG